MKKLYKLFEARSSLPAALSAVFLVWTFYRLTFKLPEWFDEFIAKAFVFGFPAWVYARSHKSNHSRMGFLNDNLWKGMFWGLFVGGIYEFMGAFAFRLKGMPMVGSFTLLSSPEFTRVFFLALMTAWWESLFFFGYVLNRTLDYFHKIELPAIVLSSFVFVAFHSPIRFLNSGLSPQFMSELFILFLFAVGQSILFLRTKSIFSIVLSHALWGIVLMIYTTG